jgi:glycosyltransferase involved in cell wall biosynthesis
MAVIQLISARYDWGGIEQHAKDLARGLKERGHRVMVVARDVEFFVRSYEEVCPVHTFPIRGSVDLQSIKGLAGLIRRQNVDIIHTHTSRDAWMALFAARLAGRGKVVTTRHVPLAAKRDIVHKYYYSKLAAIICVSQYVRNIFLGDRPAADPDKVRVVYPGTDFSRFTPGPSTVARDKLGLGAQAVIAGFVGRLTWEKGLDDLVQAMALLKNEAFDLHAVLVGEVNPITPDYGEKLLAEARRAGIGDRVHFFGFSKDIPGVMRDFDLLTLPSATPETFGLVLCEAMACGKPVITTATGAQAEIVQDGVNGLIVPPRSPHKLAAALARLAGDRELRETMGQAGHTGVTEKFGLQRMLRDVEQCYASVLE